MRQFKNTLSTYLRLVTGSIAFYPAIFAIAFSLLSVLVMWMEYQPWMLDIKKPLEFLLVKGRDEARLILGTLVGSLFSLMVFSFSMVMLLLSRASSALTPRVIPGLLTDKSNQLVLGVYLGTIVYSLLLIVNIQADDQDYNIPSFGILLGMIFGIGSLALFIYFIHAISRSIQVDTILDRIFLATIAQLKSRCVERLDCEGYAQQGSPPLIQSNQIGYLKSVDADRLRRISRDNSVSMTLITPFGSYFACPTPFLQLSGPVSDATVKDINSCFLFYPEERLDDHYLFGFRHISEIGIKALSPGINDPGTAIKVIDLLSALFIARMQRPVEACLKNADGKACLFLPPASLDSLLSDCLAPLRSYGRQDAQVQACLLDCLLRLVQNSASDAHIETVARHASSIVAGCRESIGNPIEQSIINARITILNTCLRKDQQLEKLTE